MDFVSFLNIIIPAGLVLIGMYLTIKKFLQADFDKKLADVRIKNTELILPVRLQAYERVCLLLERLSPSNIIPRVNEPGFNAAVLNQRLIAEIREEFNHNLSQQVYMSDQAWDITKKAINDLNAIINAAAQTVNPEEKGIELAKDILQRFGSLENDPIQMALMTVKAEIRQFY